MEKITEITGSLATLYMLAFLLILFFAIAGLIYRFVLLPLIRWERELHNQVKQHQTNN